MWCVLLSLAMPSACPEDGCALVFVELPQHTGVPTAPRKPYRLGQPSVDTDRTWALGLHGRGLNPARPPQAMGSSGH